MIVTHPFAQVTLNDVMAAERIFGTLGHVASTETPHCRLLLLLEESRCVFKYGANTGHACGITVSL